MRFKPFLGYMLFVTIRNSLMCQKLDLIETESETYKSQMYGHNAGQPVLSLQYTKYLVIFKSVNNNRFCAVNAIGVIPLDSRAVCSVVTKMNGSI